MMRRVAGARSGLRWGVAALLLAFVVVLLGSDPADARRRKKFRAVGYNPPYAAIVVDANTNKVLHASNADAIRHPASLTKVMTLYLLFEQLEAGKLKLDTPMRVSANAAAQAPSKLGVRPGQTIEVEDAILALITKSANDVSVVIAEAIAGDEEDFARLMTRKARALGMSRTTYTNPNGLPDSRQVTTARDQALLGRAIQDRFPKYYAYFKTKSFTYRGRTIGNHNRLVGSVHGVDGIKTGYIRASGFNLISSMRRDGRHVVAVVMGGRTGRLRDARMRSLLQGHIVEASARRVAPKATEVAEAPKPAAPAKVQIAAAGKPLKIVAAPAPGSAEPIRPIIVRTMEVRRGAPATTASVAAPAAIEASVAPAQPAAAPRQAAQPAENSGFAAAGKAASRNLAKGEWVIQIGAFPEETAAQSRLRSAQSMGSRLLKKAEPFTERVVRGETTLYRARFAGFDKDAAQAACDYLKRNDIACLAIKN